ncbi:hypothetical protein LAT59_01035 [Candidatus Gracilibacteria bacterium]|nr:hypothetical protein [Candidatus Gracilibacteria bacterium]
MKNYFIFMIAMFLILPVGVSADDVEDEYMFVEERQTSTGTELIIPEDINWTQRFILSEMRELRIDLETMRRNIYTELNERELRTVDRALSYSGNMVNFLWLILTMAVTGFGLVGWKTMKDVRENLSKNFEKQIGRQVYTQQKALEEFMQKFQEEQLAQSQEILRNQEYIQKRQEIGYYWSQYNREENTQKRLEFLEKIDAFHLEENTLLILIEKASIFAELGLWDKVLDVTEAGLLSDTENSSFLKYKAQAHIMLEEIDEGLQVLKTLLILYPAMKEEILHIQCFAELQDTIEALAL